MTRTSVTSSAENEISNNDKKISRPPPRTSTNTITSTAGTRSYEDHDHYDNDDDDDDDDVSDVGNDDPIDNYNYDNGNDDNDDEEGPRFKYSTVDLANGGCRNSKYCLIAMGVFFIVIAIAVSIIMIEITPSNDNERRLF